MGHYGKLRSREEMPSDHELLELIRAQAAKLRAGIKPAKSATGPAKPEIPVPDDFRAALNAAAQATFDKLAPSHRREYLEWIVEAKRPETRAKRIAQAAEWLAEGKSRNWKYQR
jgi:uncharacterized protein YdeI (YjbR/CyaY-like superfamily)